MRENPATIVGAGPNGLAAAIVLAGAGFNVEVREAALVAGGGTRSAELTLPGFIHDLGSAVHPLAVASPFFSTLPLAEAGLHWIAPSAELAHPLDDGTAVMLERGLADTASQLGPDSGAYRRLYLPLLENWDDLRHDLLKAIGWPQHPMAMARFGLLGLRSARSLVESHFKGGRARALFAGLSAHSFLPLESPVSAAFGLVLGIAAHAVGWPIPQGGAQSIAVGGSEQAHAKADFGEKVGGTRDYSVGGSQITISNGVRQQITGAFKRDVGAVQVNMALGSIDDSGGSSIKSAYRLAMKIVPKGALNLNGSVSLERFSGTSGRNVATVEKD